MFSLNNMALHKGYVSGVNFGGTLIPLFLVDRVGRKKMLIISSLGVVFSLCMMGGAFLLVNHDTAMTLPNPSNSPVFDPRVTNYAHCASHRLVLIYHVLFTFFRFD